MAKAKSKPRRQKLKVFRTPIGFHDAYVAAPSRKAALEAWGSTTDLFSAGIAEQVTDEKLMKQALERPGEVIRLARDGHGAAANKAPGSKQSSKRPAPKAKKGKEPSRATLDKTEAALAQLEAKQSEERGDLDREERALAKRREKLEQLHFTALEKASARRDEAEEKYRAAVAKWAD